MAIEPWVDETHNGSASISRDGEVVLLRSFRLFTGDTSSRPAWGVAAIGIYKYNSHPDDATCVAIEVNSSPVSGELGWFDVMYTYTNRPTDAGNADGSGSAGQNDPSQQPNPTLRTPVVTWGTNQRTVPFTLDWHPDGRRPVQNSAGQPFEGVEVDDYTGLITVTFNRLLPDVCEKQGVFKGKTNAADFKIIPAFSPYPAGTLKCNNWQGTFQREEGYGWYTACTVEFEFDWKGWTKELLDAGWYEHYNDGATGYVTKKITGKGGQALDAPVKLNGKGKRLTPGDTVVDLNPPYFVVRNGTPDVSVYGRFYAHERVSFTNIFA